MKLVKRERITIYIALLRVLHYTRVNNVKQWLDDPLRATCLRSTKDASANEILFVVRLRSNCILQKNVLRHDIP